MRRSRWTRALVALSLVAIPLFLSGHRVLAVEDEENRVLFGPIGITGGERALVSIYAIGNPDEIGNPNDKPWEFAVRVFDSRGGLFQEEKLQLATGVIGAVTLAVQDEENRTASALSRRTFRAEIVGFNPQPDPPGMWTATLQVVDRATGRTSLVIGNPEVLPATTRVRSPV